ncbi:unnamed protein product [Litomosoides sigmodontis]|uniref:Uncharacterized protein n=1 Tax=Litomosoides sigmodontis TaxID=42156 RepID=A0A3P6V897_LITSI|nr:unnamed protein product [Litomosoides sigmodontis]
MQANTAQWRSCAVEEMHQIDVESLSDKMNGCEDDVSEMQDMCKTNLTVALSSDCTKGNGNAKRLRPAGIILANTLSSTYGTEGSCTPTNSISDRKKQLPGEAESQEVRNRFEHDLRCSGKEGNSC